MSNSGYTYCACRDCMDVTVSSDVDKPELCESCLGEGCTPWPGFPGVAAFSDTPASGYGCQRDDAYDG